MLEIPVTQPVQKPAGNSTRPDHSVAPESEQKDDAANFDEAYAAEEGGGATDQAAEKSTPTSDAEANPVSKEKAVAKVPDEGLLEETSMQTDGDVPTEMNSEDVKLAAPTAAEPSPATKKVSANSEEMAFQHLMLRKSISEKQQAALPSDDASADLPEQKAARAGERPVLEPDAGKMETANAKMATPAIDEAGHDLSNKRVKPESGSESVKTPPVTQADATPHINPAGKNMSLPWATNNGMEKASFQSGERGPKADSPSLRVRADVAKVPEPKINLSASATTSQNASSQPVRPLTVSTDVAAFDAQPSTTDADLVFSSDPRAPQAPTGQALTQILARTDTPSMIGRQIAEALQRMPDRPVELSLNPRELGRVRLNISAGEAGITVSVLAERPETLDLMRRNIDQLAQEFRSLGYEDINFSFSGGQAEADTAPEKHAGSNSSGGSQSLQETNETHENPITLLPADGVDIRI